MHKANLPEVYKNVVDDVIANCSMIFSKKNINSIILVKLKDLWLSKLEAKDDEYIDLDYLQPREKTNRKIKQRIKKDLPNNKCELICPVQLKGIKNPEICSNLSMPILEIDTIPQNLQPVICNKSDSVIKSEKREERIKYEQPTNKKLTIKCEVESLIKTEPKAREICGNINPSNVNDELPKCCTSPILTMKNNFKSNGATKSDLSLLKSTRRVEKCIKKKCKSKLKQQISESRNNKVEIEKNTVAKTKIRSNVNWPALLKNQFQMDLENIKENTTGLKRYNYIYKNKESCENKCGYSPVKIILPQRRGYSIKQRTCIVDAPSCFLVGSRLPRLLSPLIKQVTDLTLSDAKSTLQQYINNYNNILQVDGGDTKFNLKSINYNNRNKIKQRIKKDLPNNKCELICPVRLKRIKNPEICSNLGMPILEGDTIPQNLQPVICNKSDSVIKSEKREERIKYEQPTNKKLTIKCEVESLIKPEPEAREICGNVHQSNVNDELPKCCTSPILTMKNNFKSNGATKSDLSLLKSTRRVEKCIKKKCKSKLKQQISESTNNKVEIEKNAVAKTKIRRNVNWPALLKNQFQMGLENIKENTTGLKRFNYIYKNKESCENKCGYTPVKIILPQRRGYSIKQRTCIVDAPSCFLVGSRLPRLLSPLIKQVTDLTLSDAKSTLQQYINNYNNILQVDGGGTKFNLKSINYNNSKVKKKSIKDTSDIDSNDDGTDDEDRNAAFQSDNNIMCKFSLVKHSKRKWSLQLHHGIVYVNNKVFMFKSACGDVEW